MEQFGWKQKKLAIKDNLAAEAGKCVETFGNPTLLRVRLQVFPEEAGGSEVSFVIECREIGESMVNYNVEGLKLEIFDDLIKAADSISNLKTASHLFYATAATKAKEFGADDVIVVNQDRNLVETSIANLFWVEDEVIYTPPLSEGCVAGVMRRHLLAELPGLGFPVKEKPLSIDVLRHAEEVFITNAIRRIKWVRQVGEARFSNAMSSKISAALFSK